MTTYSIYSSQSALVVRDNGSGEIIGSIPSDITISARTNSDDVVAAVGDLLAGDIIAVEHDRGELLVTCR